jgi:putative acetyltransferase
MKHWLSRFWASQTTAKEEAPPEGTLLAEEPPTSQLIVQSEATPSVQITEEQPEHWAVVDTLTRDSFGGDYEADLAQRLRDEGLVVGAFVALEDGEVVGHIMLSDLPTEIGGQAVKAACLAPLSVNSMHREQGVGARLVEEGIRALRERAYEVVFVLGDTSYYGRFGFSSEKARRVECPFPGETFMALELVPGALKPGERGITRYPKAFQLEA